MLPAQSSLKLTIGAIRMEKNKMVNFPRLKKVSKQGGWDGQPYQQNHVRVPTNSPLDSGAM